jgi:hypothetical protein
MQLNSFNLMLEVSMRHKKTKQIPTVADLLVENMLYNRDPIEYLKSIKNPLWLRYVAQELLKRVYDPGNEV